MKHPDSPQPDDRLAFAADIARQAGDLTLKFFRNRGLAVERKSDGSPVTQADREAEQLLRQLIGKQYPDDGIVGEEFGETPGTSGFCWVLDPIDGTKSFVSGVPLYTTLVAVLENNQPRTGVIYAPAADEMVFAEQGKGCWHSLNNGSPMPAQVSEVATLDDAVFVTTSARAFSTGRSPDGSPVYQALQSTCQITRTWGDAFGYLLVATGRAEVMIDPVVNLWDIAALQPIIEEAGGKFFDWQGRATVHSGDAVATNALLAEQIKKILAENSK